MEVFLIFPKSKQAQQELGQELAKFPVRAGAEKCPEAALFPGAEAGAGGCRREASESAAIIHSKRADQPQQPVCSFTAMVMSA